MRIAFKTGTQNSGIFYVSLRNHIIVVAFNFKMSPYIFINNFTKTEGESNCGKQHQSIEESSFISAADLQFPIIPKFNVAAWAEDEFFAIKL